MGFLIRGFLFLIPAESRDDEQHQTQQQKLDPGVRPEGVQPGAGMAQRQRRPRQARTRHCLTSRG
jgi:hypothetical protein